MWQPNAGRPCLQVCKHIVGVPIWCVPVDRRRGCWCVGSCRFVMLPSAAAWMSASCRAWLPAAALMPSCCSLTCPLITTQSEYGLLLLLCCPVPVGSGCVHVVIAAPLLYLSWDVSQHADSGSLASCIVQFYNCATEISCAAGEPPLTNPCRSVCDTMCGAQAFPVPALPRALVKSRIILALMGLQSAMFVPDSWR